MNNKHTSKSAYEAAIESIRDFKSAINGEAKIKASLKNGSMCIDNEGRGVSILLIIAEIIRNLACDTAEDLNIENINDMETQIKVVNTYLDTIRGLCATSLLFEKFEELNLFDSLSQDKLKEMLKDLMEKANNE